MQAIETEKYPLDMGTKKRMVGPTTPWVKWHTIPVNIKRFYTDVNGTVIPKATVPAALQVEFPFFIFGAFDFNGGYGTALKALPPINGAKYLQTFICGKGATTQSILGFTGANTIKNFIGTGDIVHLYADDDQNPTYFVWMVIKNNFGSIASIIENSETQQRDGLIGKIYLQDFNFFTDNNIQWDQPIHFVRMSNITTWGDNQVQPYIFKTPNTEQEGFLTIKCEFNLDQFLTLGMYMHFEVDTINWVFRIRI